MLGKEILHLKKARLDDVIDMIITIEKINKNNNNKITKPSQMKIRKNVILNIFFLNIGKVLFNFKNICEFYGLTSGKTCFYFC